MLFGKRYNPFFILSCIVVQKVSEGSGISEVCRNYDIKNISIVSKNKKQKTTL